MAGQPFLGAEDIQSLFKTLQREVEKDKPNLEPTRRAGIENFMDRLGTLVASETRHKTLDQMIDDRGRLDRLGREIHASGKRPSRKGAGAPAGSRSERILAALQELKMFVWSAGMQHSTSSGMRAVALDLFPRLGRLTAWINQAGSDERKVRQLECDQARGLANEVRLFGRREHVMLARPVWPRCGGLVDANRIFFSGPARVRSAIAAAAAPLGVDTDQAIRPGAGFAEHRWHDLRAANVAIFDLSDEDPQVYYELGIALAAGSQLLLLAQEGTEIPFDVEQSVRCYGQTQDLSAFIANELDAAFYGLQIRGGAESSIERTIAYAERLARADTGSDLRQAALRSVRAAKADPMSVMTALNIFNGYLGANEHDVMLTRWPGDYPDPQTPRCFAVLPFDEAQERCYLAVKAAAQKAGVEVVRGDVAEGQQVVRSIWDELCRATHVTVDLTGFNPNVCLELGMAQTLGRPTRLIGRAGTEDLLRTRLPGAAKWRCHTYSSPLRAKRELQPMLGGFFRVVETWRGCASGSQDDRTSRCTGGLPVD